MTEDEKRTEMRKRVDAVIKKLKKTHTLDPKAVKASRDALHRQIDERFKKKPGSQ